MPIDSLIDMSAQKRAAADANDAKVAGFIWEYIHTYIYIYTHIYITHEMFESLVFGFGRLPGCGTVHAQALDRRAFRTRQVPLGTQWGYVVVIQRLCLRDLKGI